MEVFFLGPGRPPLLPWVRDGPASPILRSLSCRQVLSHHLHRRSSILSYKGVVIQNIRPNFSCSVSMADGQSENNEKMNLDRIMAKARGFWSGLPKPITGFPWDKVLDNFIQLNLDVTVAVIKYLSAPLLAVSSLSELSYCAHEKKLFFVPFPLILGFVVAGMLKETTQELSPIIKDAEVPWHLIATAAFLVLLKLPGPHYPYWGRIFIPHFANGGLLRIFLMIYLWYQRPKKCQLLQSVESTEQN